MAGKKTFDDYEKDAFEICEINVATARDVAAKTAPEAKGIERAVLVLTLADMQNMASVLQRMEALSDRIAGIESKGVEYLGVWQAAASYKRGNLVTHGGSIWHANEDTRAKPGDGKTWTLACKGGSR